MNMKLTKGLLGLGALLIAGQVSAATVSVTPSVTTVSVNDPFTLTVQGSDFLDGVIGGSVILQWDPTAMTLTSSLAEIIATAPTGFDDLFNFSTVMPGQLDITLATFGAPAGVAGATFDFFSADFVAIPPPGSSNLAIMLGSGGDWQDGNLLPIPDADVNYFGAQVNVNAVPVPAAVWLFGSGLIGLVGIARRKTQLA